MTVKTIALNTHISFKEERENEYTIKDKREILLVDSNEDYHIYMNEVTFNKDGTFSGNYLGKNPIAIIDEYCRVASFDKNKGWMLPDDVILRSAKMVAVENKLGILVILQDR